MVFVSVSKNISAAEELRLDKHTLICAASKF